jgi:hypothetical protein
MINRLLALCFSHEKMVSQQNKTCSELLSLRDITTPSQASSVVPMNCNFSNFGAYLGEYTRPNKNKGCSELLLSRGMFPQKIERIGVLTVNCTFSTKNSASMLKARVMYKRAPRNL